VRFNRDRRALQLVLDPRLYATSPPLRFFEVGCIVEGLGFALRANHPRVTDLDDPTNIAFVVKAEEDLSCHTSSLLPPAQCRAFYNVA
jgi:hypothetical protein